MDRNGTRVWMSAGTRMKVVARGRRLAEVVTKYRNWAQVLTGPPPGSQQRVLALRNGVVLAAPPDPYFETVVNEIFFDHVYTRFGCALRPEDDVVDIGANVGVFSVYAGRVVRRVFSFEPHPVNVRFITANVERNGLSNIVVEAAAVGDRVGTARLYLGAGAYGHLMFDHNVSGKLGESIDVPVTTLASITEKHRLERIGLLKMDCEGAEGLILSSLAMDGLALVDRICMEYHDNVSPMDHDQIQQLLADADFKTAHVALDATFGYLYGWR